jgi:hypothetical protein
MEDRAPRFAVFPATTDNDAIGHDSRGYSALAEPAQWDSVTMRGRKAGQLSLRQRRFEFVSKALRSAGACAPVPLRRRGRACGNGFRSDLAKRAALRQPGT